MPLPSSELIGTIPQWITSASIIAIVVAWWRRGVALTGLSMADKADIRAHLSKELVRLNERLDLTERKHDHCEKVNEELREKMRKLEDELTGVYRLIAQASQDKVLMLGDNVPAHIRDAAIRAGAALHKREQENGN
jgi:hypothetical protein